MPMTLGGEGALRISKALCLQDDAAAPSSAWAQEWVPTCFSHLVPALPLQGRWLLSTPQNVPGSTAGFAFQSLYPRYLAAHSWSP